MKYRFVKEETDLFAKWKVFPNLNDSMDSLYLDDMEKLVDEAYEVSIELVG